MLSLLLSSESTSTDIRLGAVGLGGGLDDALEVVDILDSEFHRLNRGPETVTIAPWLCGLR
jgi:hypothetical protein